MIEYEKKLVKILKRSELEASILNNNYIGTEHLILAILYTNNNIKPILNKHGIYYDKIYKEIKNKYNKTNSIQYTPLLKRLILSSEENGIIKIDNLILKLIENGEGIAINILNKYNINFKALYQDIKNKNNISYGIDLNEHVKKYHEKLIGRENELNEIIEVLLRKNKNNPLLLGEPGVGKTALIEELAYRITNNDVPNKLKDKHIISINISELISGTRYRGEFEEKINNLIKEVELNDNIILFIDEIHTLVGAGGAEGAIDASNILKPYLSSNKIKCIGATTIEEYNKTILKDKALNRRFYKIKIDEPDLNETINILKHTKKYYEEYHNVSINNNQIKLIVNLADKVIKDKYNPDKSLDILDKICSKAKLQNYNNIEKENNIITENLYLQKKNYLIEKNYKKAEEITKKISNINKHKYIKINNSFIKNCFNLEKNISIGFN